MFRIIRNSRGYYTLYQDDIFEGNYDSQEEAARAADMLMHGENCNPLYGNETKKGE